MTTTTDAVCGCVPTGPELAPIGAPILPGGTEAHVRRMILGNLYIADVEGHGLVACSPHWIVPAATVGPMMAAAGLELEPGTYQVFPTGRSKEPKVHRLGSDPPVAMIGRHLDAALAANTPLHHVLHRGLPLLAASWDKEHGERGGSYVLEGDGFGLRSIYLDWLTGKAQPEDRVEVCKLRCDEGLYRLRTDGDVSRPVAVWVEEYLNARYLSHASKRTIARRSLYVLMPVRFPANG
jgi:hypothetical protein